MKRLAVPLVLAVVASSAGAFVSSAALVATRAGSAIQVTAPATGAAVAASARTISAGATTGEAKIIDMLRAAGPAGDLPLTVTRTATAVQVAAGLATLLRATTPLGLTLTAAEMLSGAGLRLDNGGEIDLGVTATDHIFTEYWIDSKAGKMPSKSQACTRYAEWMYSYGHAGSAYSADGRVERYKLNGFLVADPYWGDRCQVDKTDPFTGQLFPKFRYEGIAQQSTTQKGCIEAATGSVSKARADGKCPTGRYESVQAVPQTQLQTAVLPAVQTDTTTALKNLIDSGGYAETSPLSVTGPATQTGASQTTNTTGPSGQVSTVVTPTYNYTYNGDTITYNTTNNTVTNKTDINGETTTETKTETEPPDTEQLCDLFPSALACMKVGDIPEPDKRPEDVKLVSPGRHSAWSYNSGQCPNRTIDFSFGVSVNILQPFCDFFVILKGVILSIFSLASALVFRGGIR